MRKTFFIIIFMMVFTLYEGCNKNPQKTDLNIIEYVKNNDGTINIPATQNRVNIMIDLGYFEDFSSDFAKEEILKHIKTFVLKDGDKLYKIPVDVQKYFENNQDIVFDKRNAYGNLLVFFQGFVRTPNKITLELTTNIFEG